MSKLQLSYPVKPLQVNQRFGNPDPRYFQFGLKGHNGIDFGAYHGQPVYASCDGVCEVDVESNLGHGVVIRTNNLYDYKDGVAYFKVVNWHFLPNIPVKTGQQVKEGDLIGYADNTGFSFGDHDHFGLKPQQVNEQGLLYNIEQNNGFFGAIDPEPYLNGKYAEDIPKYLTLIDLMKKYIELLKAAISQKQ